MQLFDLKFILLTGYTFAYQRKESFVMNTGRTVFAQLMDFVPSYNFHKCVDCCKGTYKVKSLLCLDQFLCMAIARL